MSALTPIQWCDHTYNPWRGCRKVAPECEHCYIVTTPPFRMSGQVHGSARVRASEAALRAPYQWNRKAAKFMGPHPAGVLPVRPRVFCLSLGDWLDDEVPIEWLADLLKVIHDTPNLDWLLLTKRPQHWRKRVYDAWMCRWTEDGVAPENVWIGVSAGADQAAALAIPAPIHFLSAEPMLHPIDRRHLHRFDWVIFGGESGPKARFCDSDWIREGVELCRENDIPCFVKQLGANSDLHLRDKKGGDPSEWPEDLRVRQWPVERQNTEKLKTETLKGSDFSISASQRVSIFPGI